LIRAVGDALAIAGVYTDDSRIVRISARKLYAQGIEPGATILVKTLNNDLITLPEKGKKTSK
jgi:Holliday junction resolvase RusA-like endonuclease